MVGLRKTTNIFKVLVKKLVTISALRGPRMRLEDNINILRRHCVHLLTFYLGPLGGVALYSKYIPNMQFYLRRLTK